MAVPYKGSLPTAVPTGPLIYRFHELISVFGSTFKGLIHEQFGDRIMSASASRWTCSAKRIRPAIA